MKKKISFIVSFVFCLQLCFAQNYKIEYKASIVGFDLNTEQGEKLGKTQKAFVRNLNRKNEKLSELITIEVISNSDSYMISFSDVMLIDGLNGSDLKTAKYGISAFPRIYNRDGVSFGFSSSFDDVAVKSISKGYFNWEITKVSKTILGYKCFKAVSVINEGYKLPDRVFIPEEVWFAPELNFIASPGVFGDVPGAILEYKTGRALIKAISVNQTDREVKELVLEDYETISYKTYNERIRERSNKMFNN
ncbi:GLPGLI family protein [Psychroflexus sediminis]|uniref:GLPGLI family protein n=1 Tax=Psychroflexus sediminis TaxID=470826 RepID=A0A1G7Y6V3_9FLAO|nr:GLPGLI family protein [Psychroflexus sediminis]SDG92171.1 GLPGLI family protein [Psychroflexus sediminis]